MEKKEIGVKREFIVERQGRRFVMAAGLLDLAHQLGLEGVETEVLRWAEESADQAVVVKATVRLSGGRVFTAHGDASPKNVRPELVSALVRLAETRAIARALRWATNVGATALEEVDEVIVEEPARPQPPRPVQGPRPGVQPQGHRPVQSARPVGPRPVQSPRPVPAPVDGRDDEVPF